MVLNQRSAFAIVSAVIHSSVLVETMGQQDHRRGIWIGTCMSLKVDLWPPHDLIGDGGDKIWEDSGYVKQARAVEGARRVELVVSGPRNNGEIANFGLSRLQILITDPSQVQGQWIVWAPQG